MESNVTRESERERERERDREREREKHKVETETTEPQNKQHSEPLETQSLKVYKDHQHA
jgi:hypothetical protein